MPFTKRARWAFALVLVLAAGCNNSNTETLQAQLNQLQSQIQILSAKNQKLTLQYDQLASDLAELESAHEDLEARHAGLSRWAQKLAQRIGPSVWYFGTEEKPLPVKILPAATPQGLLKALNRLLDRHKLPHVDLIKIQDATAFVRIRDDRQLTQEMGSTGATGYIQAVTYTLTSLPEITYVDFDFNAGAHAVPGRYSR